MTTNSKPFARIVPASRFVPARRSKVMFLNGELIWPSLIVNGTRWYSTLITPDQLPVIVDDGVPPKESRAVARAASPLRLGGAAMCGSIAFRLSRGSEVC